VTAVCKYCGAAYPESTNGAKSCEACRKRRWDALKKWCRDGKAA
jgi:hypothetical protein